MFSKDNRMHEKLSFELRRLNYVRIFAPTIEDGDVAQLVEQRTENPCVGGSIPSITTKGDLK
jgi:hypothetical protein